MTLVAHDARARSSPAARARSARRGASSGGQPQRGRYTFTSTSTSRMPFAAAASTVASLSTATVTRAGALGHRAQPGGIDALVREQEVVAEAGAGDTDDLRAGSRR